MRKCLVILRRYEEARQFMHRALAVCTLAQDAEAGFIMAIECLHLLFQLAFARGQYPEALRLARTGFNMVMSTGA